MARRCDQVLQDTGAEIPVQDFVKEYMVARDEVFKAETIQKAFKNSGIRPLNPSIFTEADYAPSRVSSTQAHTPSTYPQAAFGYQPYTPLPCDDNDLSNDEDRDEDNTDPDCNSDGNDDGDGDGFEDNDDGNGDGDGGGGGDGEGYDGESGMDEDNLDEDQVIMADECHEPSRAPGGTNHHMPPSPLPHRAPVELPAITVGNLHQRRNSERFELDPELAQPLQLSQAMAEIQRLGKRLREVEDKLDETTTHCAMAVEEIANLKGIINAKDQRKTRSTTVALNSRWITSGAGLVEFNKQLAAQKDKKKKQAEAKQKREALAATKRAERDARGPTLAFRGSLAPKNKDDLTEIITALVIPMEAGKKFKKEELIEIIQTHLNTHPELKDNPRFTGLFGGRRQQGTAHKENLPPPVANANAASMPPASMHRHPLSPNPHTNFTTPHPPSTSSHPGLPSTSHGAYNSVHSYNLPQFYNRLS